MKLSCKEASRLLSQGEEHDLSQQQRFALELHIKICDACNRFAEQLKFLREAMRKYKQ